MMCQPVLRRTVALAAAALLAALGTMVDGQERFRFQTGVDLVNVTATVTDPTGRFVPGLKQTDFVVFEDDRPVDITHFSAERVPVSLGIVLDTSGSMTGQKIGAARVALERFLFHLLGPEDEVFLYRFDNAPHLVAGWTTDRNRISAELRALPTDGATALFDAVAEALPLLASGRHRKKALLVISDGNDTSSHTDRATLKQQIGESEALIYAIGIDAPPTSMPFEHGAGGRVYQAQRGRPFPRPPSFPGSRPPRNPPIPGVPPGTTPPRAPGAPPGSSPPATPNSPEADEPGGKVLKPGDAPVNGAALRDITDDSGGRTEIVRDTKDLDPTTVRIGDELSRQYYLGYTSPARPDGQWHVIRVEVRDRSLRVRARRGYVAAS
jgi:VWFA-related protein